MDLVPTKLKERSFPGQFEHSDLSAFDEGRASSQQLYDEIDEMEVNSEEIRRANQLALDQAVALSLYAKEENELLFPERAENPETQDQAVSSRPTLQTTQPLVGLLSTHGPLPSFEAFSLLKSLGAGSNRPGKREMAKKRGVAERPRGLCTQCNQEVAWPTTDKPTLFPLVCGHAFCRLCLAQNVRMTLSSRLVPLRCCQRLVPHEYVSEVIEPEEDVYYAFLLRPLGLQESAKKPPISHLASETSNAASAAQDGISGSKKLVDRKSAVQIRRSTASMSTTSALTGTLNLPTVEPASRWSVNASRSSTKPTRSTRSRGTDGRFIGQKGRILDEAETAARPSTTLQLSGLGLPLELCHACGSSTATFSLRFELPCRHVLCRGCLIRRVWGVLTRDDGASSVGEPVGCCGQPLPLELVQHVATRRELTKYKRLVALDDSVNTQDNRSVPTKVQEPANLAPRSTGKAAKRKATPAPRASSKRTKKNEEEETKASLECAACLSSMNSLDEWFPGPCGHGYCLMCLTAMTKLSLSDRSKVPIRCCSIELPLEYVMRVLKGPKLTLYKRFLRERDPKTSTLRSDRVYAEVVRQANGKQCPVCGVGVVKTDGCHAMMCAQGHTFCYGCGEKRCICAGSRQAREHHA